MLVAITGSTGLIGKALGDALTASGREVRPLKHGPASTGGHYDIATDWVAPGALTGVDALVHLAGASIGTARWTSARRAELVSSRIDSTRLLVDAIANEKHQPRTLMVASAIGFYGDAADRVVDEDAPLGAGFLAGLVRDWEAAAQRAVPLGVRVVSPRFGIVLSKDGGALPQMALPFKLGVGGPTGDGRQWMSWVALDDVVGALMMLLQDERASGPVNIIAPEAATNRDFARTLGKVMHRPSLAPVPGFVLRIVLGAGRADELLLASQRVEPKRLRELGYSFRHPGLEDALRTALYPTAGAQPTEHAR